MGFSGKSQSKKIETTKTKPRTMGGGRSARSATAPDRGKEEGARVFREAGGGIRVVNDQFLRDTNLIDREGRPIDPEVNNTYINCLLMRIGLTTPRELDTWNA